jgi:L-cysteine desulfidase
LYEELYFDVNIDENNKVLFKVIKDNQEDENMKSLIEDCFSFNLKEIEEYIKEMDLEKLILNPNHKLFSDFNIEDFILL